jgi:hypothetical protein
MSGSSAASLRFRRAPLAFGLCLLAFLFAIEAKTAWYAPATGPASSISAAKAWPENAPEVVRHGVPAPDPSHPLIPFAALSILFAAYLASADVARTEPVRPLGLPHFPAASFFPTAFFRPPPVR